MYNPFAGSSAPVRRARHLIGRKDAFSQLEEKVRNRQNTVIMGPEGMGKSSLLNCFFSRELRLRMAREENLLIARTNFPVHLPADEVYHYLTEAIVSSLDILCEVDPAKAEIISKQVESKRKCETGSSRLQETCKVIDDHEYDITLVIDDFENFTSSKSIQMDHHATMRHLIKSHYASYVVATNYDFNQDSLPPAVSGSFLLMEFSGNEVPLDGFNSRQCREYLDSIDPNHGFSDMEIANMQCISGGIPALLRITAEVTWNQKQLTPVLNTEAWETIQDQLYYNERVRRYLNEWCRVLTTHQIATIGQLLDERNTIGIVTGENCPKAASSLHARRLLVPRRRGSQIIDDCFAFNSLLLQDYCYNTPLSASDPHDVQNQNIANQLRQMIDEGRSTEVLEMLRTICGLMDNVTLPFDFEAPLTNEVLQEFELNLELLNSFDEDVQKQIVNGIRVERTFKHVQMKDYAPVYISFAKAIETHMNLTIVPILKKVTPNYVLPNGKSLRNMSETLMLGQINTILKSRRDGLQTVIYKEAAQYCKDHGAPDFDEKWWGDLQWDLENVKEIRNDMPHVAPLSGEDGVKLLRVLFQGEDAFTARCSGVSNALADALNAAPVQLQVGMIVSGTVRRVQNSGAFVDVGADRDGYLRISEIRFGYISDIYAELSRDQQVKVKIISIDSATGNINLSMKNVPQT